MSSQLEIWKQKAPFTVNKVVKECVGNKRCLEEGLLEVYNALAEGEKNHLIELVLEDYLGNLSVCANEGECKETIIDILNRHLEKIQLGTHLSLKN